MHRWLRLINAAIYLHLTHMTFLTAITSLIRLLNQKWRCRLHLAVLWRLFTARLRVMLDLEMEWHCEQLRPPYWYRARSWWSQVNILFAKIQLKYCRNSVISMCASTQSKLSRPYELSIDNCVHNASGECRISDRYSDRYLGSMAHFAYFLRRAFLQIWLNLWDRR